MSSEVYLLHILQDPRAEPREFSLSLFERITNEFSKERIIGEGTFGEVYVGVLRDGLKVAVKKLKLFPSSLDKQLKAFEEEVNCLKKVKHKNVVRFLGYCAETRIVHREYLGKMVEAEDTQRLLCFDYVPNGTLGKHITDVAHGLGWQERYEIIKGICAGLDHIHNEAHVHHLDLKPENILLDHNMVPKITDFGLSRFFDDHSIRTVNTIKGSRGYMAPEWFTWGGKVTRKTDVYSLGAIILKIITGSNVNPEVENVLARWSEVLCRYQTGHAFELACQQVKTCFEIAFKCLHEKPEHRPNISHIRETLDILLLGSQVTKIVFEKHLPLVESAESTDLHPEQPWILFGLNTGTVEIYNYATQEWLKSFILSGNPVVSSKFIARKQWFLAGDGDGFIYVYDYNTSQQITCFEASIYRIRSLAVHPSKPYVLSSSGSNIMLWDWEKGWVCTLAFNWHSDFVTHLKFNPTDPNKFASTSWDGTVTEWNLSSATPSFTQDEKIQELRYVDKHLRKVCLVDYWESSSLQLLASIGKIAKVWRREECIHTFKHEHDVTAACCYPEMAKLITGTENGSICLWCFETSSLEKELNFGLGRVSSMVSFEGSGRVFITHEHGLVIIERKGSELMR